MRPALPKELLGGGARAALLEMRPFGPALGRLPRQSVPAPVARCGSRSCSWYPSDVAKPTILRADELAAFSRAALDRAVLRPELFVALPSTRAVLLGAFQRPSELAEADAECVHLPRIRRGSGGAAVCVGPGSLYVGLLLPFPGALLPANEDQILNRAVRPVLRALTRTGVPTHYFGRDFLSAKKHPVAITSYAHDAGTRRTLVETFVALSATVTPHERASYDGKAPATLAELRGGDVDIERLVDQLAKEHALGLSVPNLGEAGVGGRPADAVGAETGDLLPWAARVDEAIGPLFSGRDAHGRVRLGGELVASRDRVAWLEAKVDATTDEGLGALVDEAFGAPGVAFFGVRRLASILEVLRAGRNAP